MKAIVLAAASSALAWALVLSPASEAQAQAPAPPAKTCIDQYQAAAGITAASLITNGFEIKAGWPGGLWLQKGRETYLCNTGRVPDNDPICWTLREPVKGSPCQ